MRAVALIEATANFPELCEAVERTGETVQITRHGRPVAVIAPWREPAVRSSVWTAREEFERQHGPLDEDFELPSRVIDERTSRNPLE